MKSIEKLNDDEEILEEFEEEPRSKEFEVDGSYENNKKNRMKVYFTGKKEYRMGYKILRRFQRQEIAKIELITPEDKKFDFSSLLPKGWRFKRTDDCFEDFTMKTSIRRKSITIPEFYQSCEEKKLPTLSNYTSAISLLREIGYAHTSTKALLERKRGIEARIGVMMLKGQEITMEEMKDYHQYVIIPERQAWIYALIEYGRLKKRGIDILPGVKTDKEVLKIAKDKLATYVAEFLPYKDAIKKERIKEKIIREILIEELSRMIELGKDMEKGSG